jgi:N-acetyl-D-muramate 6-phosphate phosphatase
VLLPERAAPLALLFDLDGTLIDSAPDLAAATNAMLLARGRAPLPLARLRPHVGSGARGMVGCAFGLQPQDPEFPALRDEFLARYAQCLLLHTTVFAAMRPVLRQLNAAGQRWGIVTNKALALAQPIVAGLPELASSQVLVGGDSTAHRKPHPAPLFAAAEGLRVQPAQCVYIGDDPRDIEAGRAAGMATVAAAWGYLGEALPIAQWGADHIAEEPAALLRCLQLA